MKKLIITLAIILIIGLFGYSILSIKSGFENELILFLVIIVISSVIIAGIMLYLLIINKVNNISNRTKNKMGKAFTVITNTFVFLIIILFICGLLMQYGEYILGFILLIFEAIWSFILLIFSITGLLVVIVLLLIYIAIKIQNK